MSHRILALDIGEKRIGMAITDPLVIIAQPYKTILWQNKKKFLEQLREIIQSKSVNEIVVGLPVTLQGKDSKKTREIRSVIEYLKNNLDIKIETEDESLTSVMAHKTMRELGKKPSRSKGDIDKFAAVYILQSYLKRKVSQGGTEHTENKTD